MEPSGHGGGVSWAAGLGLTPSAQGYWNSRPYLNRLTQLALERDPRFDLELCQGSGVMAQDRQWGGGDAWAVLFAAHVGLGGASRCSACGQDHACLCSWSLPPGVPRFPWECFHTSVEGG